MQKITVSRSETDSDEAGNPIVYACMKCGRHLYTCPDPDCDGAFHHEDDDGTCEDPDDSRVLRVCVTA